MTEKNQTLSQRDGKLVENWYIACRSQELSQKKPIGRMIYDHALVLFRDENGKPVCLPDRCLHRNAQLSKGRTLHGRLACPYHGWTYDSSGRVIHVPSDGPKSEKNCQSRCMKLRKYFAAEQDEFIWVWMGPGQPTIPSAPFRFPHLNERGWAHFVMITDFENEVTHLIENFMDVPHTVFVHPGLFRSQSKKKVPFDVQTQDGSVLVTYHQEQDQIGFSEKLLNPKNEPMSHTDLFILPNLTRVDYQFGNNRNFIIISQCTPVSTLKTRVYTYITYRIGWLTPFLKHFFHFYSRKVITQDVELLKAQGNNFRLDIHPNFNSTGADILHDEIERLRAWAVRGDPRSLTHVKEVREEMWI